MFFWCYALVAFYLLALAPLGLDMPIQTIPCSGFVNPLRAAIDSLPGLQRFL